MEQPKTSKHLYLWGSILTGLLLIFHYSYGYLGHFGYDDVMGYMYQAAQVVYGDYTLGDDHYAYRWGTIFLTALSYKLFGINDAAGAIPAMLITLGTALLVMKVLNKRGFGVGFIGLLIFLLNEWPFFYSDKVMPDILIALTSFGLFVTLWHLRYRHHDPQSSKHALIFSGLLLFAFVSKETIILLLPVFFLIFINDLIQRKHQFFWLKSIVFSFLIFAAYFSLIKWQTGSFWYRFKAIELGSYHNPCSYDELPIEHLIERITTGLFYVFVQSGLALALLLATPIFVSRKAKKWLKLEGEQDFWAAALLFSFLSSYYMTISYKAYVPMCSHNRHFFYLVPLAAVAAAPFVHDFLTKKKYIFSLILPSLAVFALAYFKEYERAYQTYLSVCVVLTLRLLIPKNWLPKIVEPLLILALFIALAMPNWYSMQYARTIEYRVQRDMIYRHLSPDALKKTLVVTNPTQRNFGKYFMRFRPDGQTDFISYDQIKDTDLSQYQRFLVFVNGHTLYASGTPWESLPKIVRDYFAGQKSPNLKVLDVYKKDRFVLLELKSANFLN